MASDIEERREKIISIINEELNEVYRLSSHLNHRNPDHLLRMAELNLEKARLYRDKENKEYLELPTSKRRKLNKRSFFRESNKYFDQANTLCMKIVRNYPSYKSIGEVYYIIAYNAKEANKNKTAEKYFKRAISKSRPNSDVQLKSKISLAEIYYNTKRYSSAIPLYSQALSRHKDRWWTKDSFNLAWCYYRNNQHDRAIRKMQEVYTVSSDDKYVDMRDAVTRDIGQIYATSGKISEGINFYEKLGINFTDQLIDIANVLNREGRKADADKVLNYAEAYVKDTGKKAEIYLEQLVHDAQYNRYRDHLKNTRKLMAYFKAKKLSDKQVAALTFQVQKMGAVIQKKVVSNIYKNSKTRRIYKSYANEYFDFMQSLDPAKKSLYAFYQGETSFAAKDYSEAMKYYNEAFDRARKENNSAVMKNSMEGLLAGLGQRSLSSKEKESYYIPVYENYLSMDSKSDRAEMLYTKLFKAYYDKGDYDNAEKTLYRYHRDFPKNHKTKEAMIANLMEISKKKGDHVKIRDWVARIDAGDFVVSPQYKLKLQQLLTNIQIEEVQTKLEKGDKKEALIGYHKIVKDQYSTKKSKINAKYNLAALYYELGNVDKSYEWSLNAIEEMDAKDVEDFSDSFLSISSYLFGMQYFEKSASLSEKILEKLCNTRSKKKRIAFRNSLYLYVAENKLKEAQNVLKLGRSCKIRNSVVVDATFEIIEKFWEHNLYQVYEQSLENLSFSKKYWPKLLGPYSKLIALHEKHQNMNRVSELKSKRQQLFDWSIRNKKDIPVSSLNIMAMEEMKKLDPIVSNLESTKLSFPEDTFNQLMQRKLKLLEKLTDQAVRVQSLGAPEGIVQSFKVLINAYSNFVQEMKTFKPTGKSKEFMDSFNQAMAGVYVPLEQKVKNFQVEAKAAIVKNDILSNSNADVIYDMKDSNRFYSKYSGVVMHRGGKR